MVNLYWISIYGDDEFTVYAEGLDQVLESVKCYTDDPLNDVKVIDVYRDIEPGFMFKLDNS
jgi:hypothetical protein